MCRCTSDKARRSSAAQGRAELHSWRQGASQVTGFALVKRRAQQQRHALQLRALRVEQAWLSCNLRNAELRAAASIRLLVGRGVPSTWSGQIFPSVPYHYVQRRNVSLRAGMVPDQLCTLVHTRRCCECAASEHAFVCKQRMDNTAQRSAADKRFAALAGCALSAPVALRTRARRRPHQAQIRDGPRSGARVQARAAHLENSSRRLK